MITNVERTLIKGVDYKELSVAEGGEYKYELLKDVAYLFSEAIYSDKLKRSFCSKGSDNIVREWFVLESKKGIVRKGYRWNGNSVKRVVCGVRMGSPDFEGGFFGSTIEASLFHDPLFQFSSLFDGMYFSLENANWAYKNIASQMKCRFTTIIDFILRNYSESSWKLTDTSISCSILK